MGVTKAIEDKHSMYEVLMQDGEEQAKEQDTINLMPIQAQGNAEAQLPPQSTAVHRKRQAVPIQEKALLTLEEAAEYTGLGLHKLREISNDKSCTFILWNGSKRMFKRRKLDEYLEDAYSI